MDSSERFDISLLETESEIELEGENAATENAATENAATENAATEDAQDGDGGIELADVKSNEADQTDACVEREDSAELTLELGEISPAPSDFSADGDVDSPLGSAKSNGNGQSLNHEVRDENFREEIAECADSIEPTPPLSPFRAASLSVADAIESAVSSSDQRHNLLEQSIADVNSQQAATDKRQQQIAQSVASIQSWQSQSDGRLNQLDQKQRSMIESQKAIGGSVETLLANQKTSAKCYNEVMAALNAIQATQQLDQERLDEITQQFDTRLAAVRKSMVTTGVVIGVLAVIGIIVSLLQAT